MLKISGRAPAKAPLISQRRQEPLNGSVPPRQSPAPTLCKVPPLPPAAVEAFVQALGDRDPLIAGNAATTLQGLGREAIQPLLDVLKNPGTKGVVLKAVAQTLTALFPASDAHRLAKDLLCGDTPSQCEAAEAIGDLGPEAREAIPALLWCLRKAQTLKARAAVGRALGLLGPLTPEVIPALVQALEGDPGNNPTAATDFLARPRIASAAFPRLAAGSDNHPDAVRMASEALGRIGTPEAITPLLRALRGHRDPGVRSTVAKSLGALILPVPAVVGPLVDALNDQSANVREAAIQALVTIGEGAVAELMAALHHALPEVRGRAAAALGRMTLCCWGAIDALALALDDADGGVAVHAAAAILKLFEVNASVRTSCQQKCEHSPHGYVPENERALAVLAEIVGRKGGERRNRQQAAEVLGRIGPSARVTFRTLAEVVADESDNRLVRGSARWALQRLGPEKEVKPKAP